MGLQNNPLGNLPREKGSLESGGWLELSVITQCNVGRVPPQNLSTLQTVNTVVLCFFASKC